MCLAEKSENIVQFQKISIPTTRKFDRNSKGGGMGSQKPTFLNESMKLNWNFHRDTEGPLVWCFVGLLTDAIIVYHRTTSKVIC